MFIYVIVCSENLKIYVGQHKGENLQRYLWQKFSHARQDESKRSHLYNAMRKYPHTVWSIHSLVSDVQDVEVLHELERHYIKVLNARHPEVGYNICRGGEGGRGVEMTPEVRAKIGAATARWQVGRKQSPETIAKRVAKTRGQKRTPEQRAMMREATKGNGAQFGHPVSEEARKKIGEKNKAGWTPERRAAFSEYKRQHPTGVAVRGV